MTECVIARGRHKRRSDDVITHGRIALWWRHCTGVVDELKRSRLPCVACGLFVVAGFLGRAVAATQVEYELNEWINSTVRMSCCRYVVMTPSADSLVDMQLNEHRVRFVCDCRSSSSSSSWHSRSSFVTCDLYRFSNKSITIHKRHALQLTSVSPLYTVYILLHANTK